MKQSQSQWILAKLNEGHAVTAIDALEGCGCFRLAARINDLRTAGHNIQTRTRQLPNGKSIASYHLTKKEPATC